MFEFCVISAKFGGNVSFILVLVLLLFMIINYNYKRMELYKCSWKLPGPWSLPLIGNAQTLLFSTPQDIMPIFQWIVGKYGFLTTFWLGPELNIIVSDPKYVETVLLNTSTLKKGASYKYIQAFLGEGLLGGWGAVWKRERKLILPFFSSSYLVSYLTNFNKHAQILVKNLSKYADGETFDIFHAVANCTHNSVCETLLGVETQDSTNDSKEFLRHIDKMYEVIFLRMSKWWYQNDFIYKSSKYYTSQKQILKYLDSFFAYIRQKKRDNVKVNKNPAALDAITNSNMSTKEYNQKVLTLQTASQESTATIISFILMVLGIHKDVQAKVCDELDQVFEETDREITPSDLRNLMYLDCVVKEILRLFPIGAVITRSLENNLKLTDEIILPSGCIIVLPIYAIHHHPELWRDPESFIPERFFPEEAKDRHAYCYLPFSHGPMNCAGQRYAIWIIKTVVASILRHYEVDTPYSDLSQVKIYSDISIRPVDGYPVSLTPKKRKPDL